MTGLLLLAFGAGMLAPVNPCGFALLPAYLAYGTRTSVNTTDPSTWARLASGLRSGLALTLGFTGTFTIVGLLLAAGLRAVIGVVPWLAAALGLALVLLGAALLLGLKIRLGVSRLHTLGEGRGRAGMIAFGVGYALASASCSLAILLAVVTQAMAGTGLVTVLAVFAAYAAGSSTVLLTLAVVTAFAGTLITQAMRRLIPYMNRITGAVLAISGGYLLAYWMPQLAFGTRGLDLFSGAASVLSGWIRDNQLAVIGIAGAAAIVGISATIVRRLLSKRNTRQEEDRSAPAVDEAPGARHAE
jgi:cytochrome c-type biogenesis protein|uniref:Putative mercury transport protein n=1 Tax=Rhodococcus sp. Mel TaxID=1093626 RepID=H8ZKW8_9NOCA|nr:putative mercury transport protein [Rhodococcus sp. Mel]